jgi:glycine cleavage system aminomethyltransferase T
MPASGALLASHTGADVGRVTSISEALDGAGWIALAYLARDYADVGTSVTVKETGAAAVVEALGQ